MKKSTLVEKLSSRQMVMEKLQSSMMVEKLWNRQKVVEMLWSNILLEKLQSRWKVEKLEESQTVNQVEMRMRQMCVVERRISKDGWSGCCGWRRDGG